MRSVSPIRSSCAFVSPGSGSPKALRSLPARRSSRGLCSRRMNSCHPMPLMHPSAPVGLPHLRRSSRGSPPRFCAYPFPEGCYRFISRLGGAEISWLLFTQVRGSPRSLNFAYHDFSKVAPALLTLHTGCVDQLEAGLVGSRPLLRGGRLKLCTLQCGATRALLIPKRWPRLPRKALCP